jgi:hypothetical protein
VSVGWNFQVCTERGVVNLVMENIADEELIRRYLLGDVTQKEKDDIQDRLFLDSMFLDHLLIIEDELTNDYLLDKLTSDKRMRFEEYFLRAPERRRRLRVSKQLKELASPVKDKPTIAPNRIRQRVAWKWLFLNPRLAISVIMIIFSVVLLWLLRDRQILKSRIAELRSQQDSQQEYLISAQQGLANEQAENQELRKRVQDEQQKVSSLKAQIELLDESQTRQTLRIAKQRRSQIDNSEQLISTTKPNELWPDQTRDSGKTNIVRIKPTVKQVLLQLNLEEDKYKSYMVETRNADNERIWRKTGIKAKQISSGKALIVKIPAQILTTGDYIIMVRGAKVGDRSTRINSYQFKVEKE